MCVEVHCSSWRACPSVIPSPGSSDSALYVGEQRLKCLSLLSGGWVPAAGSPVRWHTGWRSSGPPLPCPTAWLFCFLRQAGIFHVCAGQKVDRGLFLCCTSSCACHMLKKADLSGALCLHHKPGFLMKASLWKLSCAVLVCGKRWARLGPLSVEEGFGKRCDQQPWTNLTTVTSNQSVFSTAWRAQPCSSMFLGSPCLSSKPVSVCAAAW